MKYEPHHFLRARHVALQPHDLRVRSTSIFASIVVTRLSALLYFQTGRRCGDKY
ncbi:hypothetical protein BDR03DRAFT_974217 [Suillus americanus]|nr:hypothetical protein BDR03DRAFT_974217 [Suillus americanus]